MIFENGAEIVGNRHHSKGTYIGAAGVADRIAPGPRTGRGDDETQYLAEDLATVVLPEPRASIARWVRTCGIAIG